MFVKLKEGLHYNLSNVSSFELNKDYITIFLNCCNSEGGVVYETIYFDNQEHYETAKKTLLETIKES
jgi:hypothetical protein